MARAQLLQDNNNERDYKISGNRIITIKIDDELEISYLENEEQIGNDDDFAFSEDEFQEGRYLLRRMYVPIEKEGLGRATLEFFKDYTDAIVWARPDDHIKHDDGSYLTGDAPAFVNKMIEEGLLEDNRDLGEEFEY